MGGRRLLISAVIAVVATAGLGACGGSSTGGSRELAVLAATSKTRFDPDQFRVRFNRETVFTFQNKDKKQAHNFTLTYVFTDPDNFVSVDVPPGQQMQVKFTVTQRPAAGSFTFYCRFHQSQGMAGKITLL